MLRTHPLSNIRRVALAALLALAVSACGSDESTGTDDDGVSSGAAAPGGALTVEDVLDRSGSDQPLAVHGFLIDDGSGPRMCRMILESYPPQCGGGWFAVEGVDVASLEGATVEGATSWVEDAQLVGTYDGETFTVTDTTI